MITNADITIYNKRYMSESRSEKFAPTPIRDVSFYSRKGTVSGSQEMKGGDTYTVRIPADADTFGKQYVDYLMYENMGDDVYNSYWTIQPGSIIVKGLHDGKELLSEVELRKRHMEVMFVTNFTDNRDRCSDAMKHWRIGGE